MAHVSPNYVMFMNNSMLLWWTWDSEPLPLVIKPKVVKEALQWTVLQEAEGQRLKAHPQKFWIVENRGKIPENSGTDVSTPLFSLCDEWDWLSKCVWIWLYFSKNTWTPFFTRKHLLLVCGLQKNIAVHKFFGHVWENSCRNPLVEWPKAGVFGLEWNRSTSTGSTFHALSFVLMSSSQFYFDKILE